MDIVKKNIVSIVCGVVALIAIIAAFWPLGSYVSALETAVDSREAMDQSLRGFQNKNRNWPTVTLEAAEAISLEQFPSEKVIAAGTKMVEDVKREAVDILAKAVSINAHELLVPGSLPTPSETQRLDFREYYRIRNATQVLIDKVLNGGEPPTPESIAEEQQRVSRDVYDANIVIVGEKATNEEETKAMIDQAAARVPGEMRARVAVSKSIYVSPTALLVSPAIDPVGGAPDPTSIWSAQLLLWMQADICKAIAETNEGKSIIDSPIKHLLELVIFIKDAPAANLTRNQEMPLPSTDPNAPLPKDPVVSASGRVSNALYDVHGFLLKINVDAEQIPNILTKLSANRYLTILTLQIKSEDVAEYAGKGFVYGGKPIVSLSIVGEILYLRNWTEKLMPVAVKKKLGLISENQPVME